VNQKIEQKLRDAKITFEISEPIIENQKKQCSPYVNQLIFDDILNTLKNVENKKLRIIPSRFQGFFFLEIPGEDKWEGKPIASNDKVSIEFIQTVIEQIERDELIINNIKDINLLNDQLKNNPKLQQFDKWRKEIINEVCVKNKPLYGRCDDNRCY
jgi:hypothetical protein